MSNREQPLPLAQSQVPQAAGTRSRRASQMRSAVGWSPQFYVNKQGKMALRPLRAVAPIENPSTEAEEKVNELIAAFRAAGWIA